MCRRRLETGISFRRDPVGEPVASSQNFERQLKEGSGNGASFSVGAL